MSGVTNRALMNVHCTSDIFTILFKMHRKSNVCFITLENTQPTYEMTLGFKPFTVSANR